MGGGWSGVWVGCLGRVFGSGGRAGGFGPGGKSMISVTNEGSVNGGSSVSFGRVSGVGLAPTCGVCRQLWVTANRKYVLVHVCAFCAHMCAHLCIHVGPFMPMLHRQCLSPPSFFAIQCDGLQNTRCCSKSLAYPAPSPPTNILLHRAGMVHAHPDMLAAMPQGWPVDVRPLPASCAACRAARRCVAPQQVACRL